MKNMIKLFPEHFATPKHTILFFNKINHISLTFNYLTPKERDIHCSHQIRLRTIQTHTNYKFIQHHYLTNTPSRNPQHRFKVINTKYTSPFFVNFTYCIKDINMQGIIRNYDPIRRMYIICPLAKCFNVKDSRPLIVHHEYIQPVEAQILEYIHPTNYNHKFIT